MLEQQVLLLPGVHLPCSLAQHPGADLTDESAVFRYWNEFGRSEQSSLRMAPANQGLGAGDCGVREIHLGLVVELELAQRERASQIRLEFQSVRDAFHHIGGKLLDLTTSTL